MILPKLTFKWERWKFNSDYGVYVSTLGHFKDRYKRDIPVKIDAKGYVKIKTEQGYRFGHRLVMITWRPTDDAENLTVDHLNHNKRDNSLVNLEWVTEKENLLRARNDQLTKKEERKENKTKIVLIGNLKGVEYNYPIAFDFDNEESFVDTILWVCEKKGKKVKRTKEQLVEYIKNCQKMNSKYEMLGFKWKRVEY